MRTPKTWREQVDDLCREQEFFSKLQADKVTALEEKVQALEAENERLKKERR